MLDKKSVSQYTHWDGWNKYEDSCLTTGPDCKLSLINISKNTIKFTQESQWLWVLFFKVLHDRVNSNVFTEIMILKNR